LDLKKMGRGNKMKRIVREWVLQRCEEISDERSREKSAFAEGVMKARGIVRRGGKDQEND
jgi:hypothetical protein